MCRAKRVVWCWALALAWVVAGARSSAEVPEFSAISELDSVLQLTDQSLDTFITSFHEKKAWDSIGEASTCFSMFTRKGLGSLTSSPGQWPVQEIAVHEASLTLRFAVNADKMLFVRCRTGNPHFNALVKWADKDEEGLPWRTFPDFRNLMPHRRVSIVVTPSQDIYIHRGFGIWRVATMYPVLSAVALYDSRAKVSVGVGWAVQVALKAQFPAGQDVLQRVAAPLGLEIRAPSAPPSRLKRIWRRIKATASKLKRLGAGAARLPRSPSPQTAGNGEPQAASSSRDAPAPTTTYLLSCRTCQEVPAIWETFFTAATMAEQKSATLAEKGETFALPFAFTSQRPSPGGRRLPTFMKRKGTRPALDPRVAFFMWQRSCPQLLVVNGEAYDEVAWRPFYLHKVTFRRAAGSDESPKALFVVYNARAAASKIFRERLKTDTLDEEILMDLPWVLHPVRKLEVTLPKKIPNHMLDKTFQPLFVPRVTLLPDPNRIVFSDERCP